jgi:hypothetical protein
MKNAIPAKGVRLLRKVAKHILAEPECYDQNTIVLMGNPCGTVACIGGRLSILTNTPLTEGDNLDFDSLVPKIGVTHRQLWNLCQFTYSDGWPRSFRNAYNKAKTPETRAKIAAARIEHFIKTGE